jgi:hypothetical protein
MNRILIHGKHGNCSLHGKEKQIPAWLHETPSLRQRHRLRRLSGQGELIGCFARGPEIVTHHEVCQTSG